MSRRDSIVDEDHRVGDRVFVVRTRDTDGDPITFSLGPGLYYDVSKYFRIDPQTGEVFLKQSLEGLGGQNYYMYVKADDGHHQAKMEVSIKVIRSAHKSPLERKEELDAEPNRPRAVDNLPVHLNVSLPPELPKTIMLPSDLTTSGTKGTSMSPTLAVLGLALPIAVCALLIYFGINKTKKHRGSFKKGIKCVSGTLKLPECSFFRLYVQVVIHFSRISDKEQPVPRRENSRNRAAANASTAFVGGGPRETGTCSQINGGLQHGRSAVLHSPSVLADRYRFS